MAALLFPQITMAHRNGTITRQVIHEMESRVGAQGVALARLRFKRYIEACEAMGVPSRAMGQRGHAYIEALEEAERGETVEMLAGVRGDERDYERRDFSGHYDW